MAFVQVARIGDIAPGGVKYVDVDGEKIAVCHVGGRFYAVAGICTHDGGSLDQGQVDGYEIECPRHGARFDVRSGAVKRLPAVMPLPTYELRVEGDAILIEVE